MSKRHVGDPIGRRPRLLEGGGVRGRLPEQEGVEGGGGEGGRAPSGGNIINNIVNDNNTIIIILSILLINF